MARPCCLAGLFPFRRASDDELPVPQALHRIFPRIAKADYLPPCASVFPLLPLRLAPRYKAVSSQVCHLEVAVRTCLQGSCCAGKHPFKGLPTLACSSAYSDAPHRLHCVTICSPQSACIPRGARPAVTAAARRPQRAPVDRRHPAARVAGGPAAARWDAGRQRQPGQHERRDAHLLLLPGLSAGCCLCRALCLHSFHCSHFPREKALFLSIFRYSWC